MSRRWILLGVAVLVLTLGACGGKEEGGGGNEAASTAAAGPVSIDLWHMETGATETTLQRLVDRFNASQNEVKVRLVFQGGSSEVVLKLLTSLRAKEVPALVELVEADVQVMVDSGGVTPVQEFVDADKYGLSDFDEKAVQYYTVDNKLYAMPFAVSVPMLYYNKTAFREVGLDPEKPPLTFDDVRADSEKLYKVDGAGNVVRSGIALDMTSWWLEVTLAGHDDLFVNNNNGRDGRATEAVFNNPTGQALFRWWDEMVKSGLGFNVGLNPAGADALIAVGAGRAAMALQTSQALRSIFDVLEAGVQGVELGVGPFPAIAGGTNEPGVGSRGLWIMKDRSEAEQRAAWKAAQWLAEPEQQAEFFAGSGFLPVRVSAYDLEASRQVIEKYPEYQVPVDQFVGTPSTPARLGALIGPFSQVRDIVGQAWEEMVVGGKDPVQALDDAAERATKELQDYNSRVGTETTPSSTSAPTESPEKEAQVRDMLFQNDAVKGILAGREEGRNWWLTIDYVYAYAEPKSTGEKPIAMVNMFFDPPVSWAGQVPTKSNPCQGHYQDDWLDPNDPCRNEPSQYGTAYEEFSQTQGITAEIDLRRGQVVQVFELGASPGAIEDARKRYAP